MASSNPVSPKVIAAGIGSVVGPIVLEFALILINVVASGQVAIPEPWNGIVSVLASLLGAVAAAYRTTDPLRLPTIDKEAVEELNTP